MKNFDNAFLLIFYEAFNLIQLQTPSKNEPAGGFISHPVALDDGVIIQFEKDLSHVIQFYFGFCVVSDVGQDLVVAVKGRELPAHMPQTKRGIGLLYAVNPGGADHTIYEHDPSYERFPDRMAELDLMDPQPADVLNAEKVRYLVYTQRLISSIDCVCTCKFVYGPAWQLYSTSQLIDAIRAITGWGVTLWELMKVGERRLNLLRSFNAREGAGAEADTMPPKLLIPLQGGATDGVAVPTEEFEKAKALYYRMVGWDENGHPTRAKLEELALGWVADELKLVSSQYLGG